MVAKQFAGLDTSSMTWDGPRSVAAEPFRKSKLKKATCRPLWSFDLASWRFSLISVTMIRFRLSCVSGKFLGRGAPRKRAKGDMRAACRRFLAPILTGAIGNAIGVRQQSFIVLEVLLLMILSCRSLIQHI